MTETRKTPLLGWLLFGSLVVNLLLVGLFVGGWLFHGPHNGPHGGRDGPRGLQARFEERLDRIDESVRPRVAAIHARYESELTARFEGLRAARRAVRRALEADPFDPAVLEDAQARLQDATQAMQTSIHNSMREIAPLLDAEDRRAYFGRGPGHHR